MLTKPLKNFHFEPLHTGKVRVKLICTGEILGDFSSYGEAVKAAVRHIRGVST